MDRAGLDRVVDQRRAPAAGRARTRRPGPGAWTRTRGGCRMTSRSCAASTPRSPAGSTARAAPGSSRSRTALVTCSGVAAPLRLRTRPGHVGERRQRLRAQRPVELRVLVELGGELADVGVRLPSEPRLVGQRQQLAVGRSHPRSPRGRRTPVVSFSGWKTSSMRRLVGRQGRGRAEPVRVVAAALHHLAPRRAPSTGSRRTRRRIPAAARRRRAVVCGTGVEVDLRVGEPDGAARIEPSPA